MKKTCVTGIRRCHLIPINIVFFFLLNTKTVAALRPLVIHINILFNRLVRNIEWYVCRSYYIGNMEASCKINFNIFLSLILLLSHQFLNSLKHTYYIIVSRHTLAVRFKGEPVAIVENLLLQRVIIITIII